MFSFNLLQLFYQFFHPSKQLWIITFCQRLATWYTSISGATPIFSTTRSMLSGSKTALSVAVRAQPSTGA
ncbi:hypothetical protein [Paraglaciecola psychrophila]|uniref:hypothetical protein n=1 Tax=Paraglaciecola psychrophila TaxID=326544 RepID=UPI001390C2DE|nr:hypothetical protein [Paraglaciecola psychrophila]